MSRVEPQSMQSTRDGVQSAETGVQKAETGADQVGTQSEAGWSVAG